MTRAAYSFFFVVMGLSVSSASAQTTPADAPVFIHVESPNPNVEVIRVLGQSVGTGYVGGQEATVITNHLERMCRAPCDLFVPGGFKNEYFIEGKGVSASESFDLTSYGDSVNVKVNPGSAFARTGGYLLGYTGAAGLVLGGTSVLLANTVEGGFERGDGPTYKTLAIGGLVGGVALLVTGIIVAKVNGTSFTLEKGAPPPSAPNPAAVSPAPPDARRYPPSESPKTPEVSGSAG